MGWNSKPKSPHLLISIGKRNIIYARKKIRSVEHLVDEMNAVLQRSKEQQVLKPQH